MMYLFLICHNPDVGLGPDDPPTLQPRHAELSQQLRAEGRHVSGGAPLPYDAGTVVRVQGRKRLANDGPFAEVKEVVGMRIPVASNACVQVRPLWIHNPE